MEENYLKKYLEVGPISLSIVRAIECRLLTKCEFIPPILDIGCGDGLFGSILLSNNDKKFDVGIDISWKEIEKAKKTNSYNELRVCEIGRLPFKDEEFSTIISNCVIEHILGLEEAFNEISRILKKGGKFIFTTHSHLFYEYLFYPSLFRKIGLGFLSNVYINILNKHFKLIHCFHIDKWKNLLSKSGLEVVEYKYYLAKSTENIFDIFLIFSIPSYIYKKLFNRWVIFPRGLIIKIFEPILRKYYEENAEDGGGLLIIAQKK